MADQTPSPHQTPPSEQLDPSVPLTHDVPAFLQLLITFDEEKGISITQTEAAPAEQQYSSVASLQVLTSTLVGLMHEVARLGYAPLDQVLAQVQNRLDYETFPPEEPEQPGSAAG